MQALSSNGDVYARGCSAQACRKAQVQSKIAAEFVRLDPVSWEWVLGIWKKATKATHTVRSREYHSLEEYLSFRVSDAYAEWALALFSWAQDIHLTDDEERMIDPIRHHVYAAMTLTNDYFSWPKEYKAHMEDQEIPLINAVHVVMQCQSCSEETAKEVVKAEIRRHETLVSQFDEKYAGSPQALLGVIKWLRMCETALAGNYIWSSQAPRYFDVESNPYKDHLATLTGESV
ncbi:terpenoid synthase [Aspergillus piperis CBS 112811]|uniref:Terpenoid synthase n=1 Tax=Aspergillus piperis CBS 112811 TaxID=1448313 RepID=A0A8G1R0Y2_9EURO|nr:terpenoid synthase [Aspergillus piperis CBS 112811]RAH56249.1 terpenoid synthase [Aspergillus piperis CBS 112811]